MELPVELAGSAQVRFITPEQATRLLTTCAFPRQRVIRSYWVEELAGILQRGEWATSTITLAGCKQDGRVYLVDGYHRLGAIVKSERPALLIINSETCESMDEVSLLYGRLDRGIPRSMSDSLIACQAPAKTDLPLGMLRKAITAINVMRCGFRTPNYQVRNRGIDQSLDEIKEWAEAIRTYASAIERGQRSIVTKLRNAPYLSVAMVVCRYQPEKGHTFFHGVATNDGLVKLTPQHLLHSRIYSSEIQKLGNAIICRKVAECWNAFYLEKPTVPSRPVDPNKPIVLLGTPYEDRG